MGNTIIEVRSTMLEIQYVRCDIRSALLEVRYTIFMILDWLSFDRFRLTSEKYHSSVTMDVIVIGI